MSKLRVELRIGNDSWEYDLSTAEATEMLNAVRELAERGPAKLLIGLGQLDDAPDTPRTGEVAQ